MTLIYVRKTKNESLRPEVDIPDKLKGTDKSVPTV